MRGKLFTFTVFLILLSSPLLIVSDDSDARMPYFGLMLDMVCPTGSEGFTLHNNSPYDVDLGDYSVTDGEGTVTFSKGLIIKSDERMTFLVAEPEKWMMIDNYILIDGNKASKTSKFSLADNGDDLYLMKGETVIDSFYWGSKFEGQNKDDGLSKIPKKTFAIRNRALVVGGETEVWETYVPGTTNYFNIKTFSDAIVTPFSFPESGGEEILNALQNAESEVCVSAYTIDHPRIASVLAHLLSNGISVKMLIEGGPAGGISNDELRTLAALSKAGADIHVIKSNDSYKRYPYVHAKYAIVDSSTAIITSENWTESSFGNNRGWGCVIENDKCASYLKSIFENDYNPIMQDIQEFRSVYPSVVPSKIQKYTPVSIESRSYVTDVSPILSPDYSWKALMSYLGTAEERVYTQQLNIEYDWVVESDNPLKVMEQLYNNGVDCRVLVDVTFESPSDDDFKDGFGLCMYYEDKGTLKTKYVDSPDFDMSHNKGIVCDDSVWIGSMNWTNNSIRNNREVSVIVYSEEVSDYFASLFLKDWGTEYNGTVNILIDLPKFVKGEQSTISAIDSSVPQGSLFEWDMDGDGEAERIGQTISWRFYETTEFTLYVTTPDGDTYEQKFVADFETEPVEKKEGFDFVNSPVKYVPLILLVAILITLKRIKSGKA